MYHVTPEIYGKLASEIGRAVERAEGGSFYDYEEPDGIRGAVEAETEDGKFYFVLDFYAMPGYRYEEINPGLYAPYDSKWGYTRTSLSVDCRKFTVTDEDDTEQENDFSEKELATYLNQLTIYQPFKNFCIMEQNNVSAVAQQPENTVSAVDFSRLPDLNEAQVDPVELSGEYWTPEKEGESRRVFFAGLVEESVLEMDSGETRQLVVAKFVEQRDGQLRAIRNGSRRLVGIFEQFANTVKIGDAFEITYRGKRKNTTNSFKSDSWSVKPLTFKK